MPKLTFNILLISAFLWIVLSQCAQTAQAVQVNPMDPPFERLADYHFFQGQLADLSPNDGVLPYDLNTPLFTDYAHKERFVWLPPNSSIDYRSEGVLDFPIGSVLIKNFYYFEDETKVNSERRIIETRLLIQRPDGWEPHSYLWNEQQDEARLDIVGDIVPVSWTDQAGVFQAINYLVPNKNQCKGCHSYDGKIAPIGPKVRNLNKDFPYSDGIANQLTKWTSLGYLNGYRPEEVPPKTVVWNDEQAPIHQRALAYLDSNCGHCHNPHGPGGTTGLNLVYDAPTDLNLGILKAPVAAGRASGGHSYSIVPGAPDQSILHYRMLSTEPGVMMPELGRTLVHQEGVSLIREWIAQLEPISMDKTDNSHQ